MTFKPDIHLKLKKEINKLCRRNPVLREALEKKMKQILLDPYHPKPLRNDLAGERRVHVWKSFVLKFTIEGDTVRFLRFGHHDEIYERKG